jgi:hypothetical protein
MTPTRSRPLLVAGALIAVVVGVLLRVWSGRGNELPALPWTAPAVMGLMALAILVTGWPVRRWTRGDRTRQLNPLRAARTVVLAKAAQYAGAALTGWYAGQALALLPTLDVPSRRALMVRALVSAATSIAVWVAGWAVERFCRVDRSDEDEQPPRVTA